MRLFGSLLKAEENDDGTLTVEGIASAESVDAAGETVLGDAMRDALPDFFEHGTGNLREMHQLLAAGTVDAAETNADGETRISATVVDPIAVQKVKAGVYKGFSIGGKVLARDPKDRKVITKIRLIEISLVDRPCNPDAKIEMWKADRAEDDPMKDHAGAETAPEAEARPEETAKAAAPETAKPAPAAEPAAPEAKPGEDAGAPSEAEKADTAPADAKPEADVTKAEAGDGGTVMTAEAADPAARAAAAVAALEESVSKATAADRLSKGMYTVSRFAETLDSIACIIACCEYEAEYEGDDSPVPPKLRAWLAAGAELFKELAVEEVDELIAHVTAKRAADVAKAAGADGADTLGKVSAERDALLEKLAARDEALTSLAGRVEPLAKALEGLTARLAKVEAEPAPAKTAGPLAKAEPTPVSKEQDAGGPGTAAGTAVLSDEDVQKALDAMSPDDRALALTKAALRMPRRIG